MKRTKHQKQASLFVRTLNRLLKLPLLKLMELSLGWVKGFSVKVEFFEDKRRNKPKIKKDKDETEKKT